MEGGNSEKETKISDGQKKLASKTPSKATKRKRPIVSTTDGCEKSWGKLHVAWPIKEENSVNGGKSLRKKRTGVSTEDRHRYYGWDKFPRRNRMGKGREPSVRTR